MGVGRVSGRVILGLSLAMAGCLPPAVSPTGAPTVVGQMELPAVRLEPGVIEVDGKPAVKVGPVTLKIVAKKYSSGSVYYEIKSLTPDKEEAFVVLQPRVVSTEKYPDEAARANGTQLHVAYRRTLKENDVIRLHVTLEVERTDAGGVEHPPVLLAKCTTELWGRVSVFIGEQKLIDTDGPPRWSEVNERVENQKREDLEAVSPSVKVAAGAEWVPVDKSEIKPGTLHPIRRAIGDKSFVMKQE